MSSKEDQELQLQTIDLMVKDMISDMGNMSKSSKKIDMIAYVSAWKNTLETITHIIDIQ